MRWNTGVDRYLTIRGRSAGSAALRSRMWASPSSRSIVTPITRIISESVSAALKISGRFSGYAMWRRTPAAGQR
jgi:hypothetical protein